jgi:methyl-accepting chemotaxis protein
LAVFHSLFRNIFKESEMTGHTDSRIGSSAADSLARGVKNRVRFLILAGMVIVALVFGLTFYFALLENQTALARQVPELEVVAAKLKSILVMNTLSFIAIIIASFFALSSIIVSRTFQPLAILHRNLLSIAEGRLPRSFEATGDGQFSALDDAFKAAVSTLYDRERKEVELLYRCAETLDRNTAVKETANELKQLAARKSTYIGATENRGGQETRDAETDPLFMQPL